MPVAFSSGRAQGPQSSQRGGPAVVIGGAAAAAAAVTVLTGGGGAAWVVAVAAAAGIPSEVAVNNERAAAGWAAAARRIQGTAIHDGRDAASSDAAGVGRTSIAALMVMSAAWAVHVPHPCSCAVD